MKTLVERVAYDEDPTGFFKRLPWAAGLFLGFWMGLFSLVAASDGSLLARWVTASLLGTVAGALFGMLMTWWFRLLLRRTTNRIYQGDLRLVATPPDGYASRLPCGRWMRTQRAVPGVLYLGAPGALFLPHTRFGREGRFILSPAALSSVGLALRAVPQSWLERRLSLRAPSALVLTVMNEEFILLVPQPDQTLEKLQFDLALLAGSTGRGAA